MLCELTYFANLSQVIPAADLSLISYHFEDCFGLFHQAHVYHVHLNEQTWPQAWKLSNESLFQQRDNLSKERILIEVKLLIAYFGQEIEKEENFKRCISVLLDKKQKLV